MNFSAQKARRNRPCGDLRCSAAAMVTVAAVALMLCGQTEPAAARVRPRSVERPVRGASAEAAPDRTYRVGAVAEAASSRGAGH